MCFDYYEIIYFKSFENELQKFFEVDLEKKIYIYIIYRCICILCCEIFNIVL